jgi:hypothetical protein
VWGMAQPSTHVCTQHVCSARYAAVPGMLRTKMVTGVQPLTYETACIPGSLQHKAALGTAYS